MTRRRIQRKHFIWQFKEAKYREVTEAYSYSNKKAETAGMKGQKPQKLNKRCKKNKIKINKQNI